MAYVYTTFGKNKPLYCGEEDDRCFNCGISLNGKDCLGVGDFLICLDHCYSDY